MVEPFDDFRRFEEMMNRIFENFWEEPHQGDFYRQVNGALLFRSREDVDITKKLVETGKIMGIDVLDHVIIGDGRHFSMKEAGHI